MVLRAFLVVALALLVATCGERTSGPTSPFKSTDISRVDWGATFT